MFDLLSKRISEAMLAGCGTSMHLCGSPGVGKTSTVLCITEHMLSAQAEILSSEVTGESTKSRPPRRLTRLEEAAQKCDFKVVNINGMHGDLDYRQIGCAIGIFNATKCPSLKTCKSEVFHRFKKQVPPHKRGGKRTCMTVLIIDEMDKVNKGELAELLTIAGTNCGGEEGFYSEFSEGSETNSSSLIVIGISNNISFPSLNLKMNRNALPRHFVFESYNVDKLQRIIFHRSCGLFDTLGVQLIARKVAGKDGNGYKLKHNSCNLPLAFCLFNRRCALCTDAC